MTYNKYEVIHYRLVKLDEHKENTEWREAELIEYSIWRLHIRVKEPLHEGALIEIKENKFSHFYYEVIEVFGCHVKLWDR